MKSAIANFSQLKKLMFVISCFILAITTSSWNPGDKNTEQVFGVRIEKNLPIKPDPIKLEACTFSTDQLKGLLQANVRKILFEYYNDGGNHTLLVAYGADKDNNKLTGPIKGTYMAGSTVTVAPDVVVSNQELSRARMKKLYGFRTGHHERIDEGLILGLEFFPEKTADGGHIRYKVVNPTKLNFAPEYTNPSPPARPCDDCDDPTEPQ